MHMRLIDEKAVCAIINEGILELVKDENTIVDFVSCLTDSRLYGHLLGVAKISVQLGMSYQFPHRKLVDLGKAGLLHDIGKLFIDPDILYRPCKLTPAEFAIVQQHPRLGYEHMRGKLQSNSLMADAIMHHHEKLGGAGYPDGEVKSRFITELITVADIYSALTEFRVYKEALPVDKAFEILQSDDGLNQSIVQRLRELTYDDLTDLQMARKYASWYRRRMAYKQMMVQEA